MYKEVAKQLNKNYYSDINEAGGLNKAIYEAFLAINSSLKPESYDTELPFIISCVKHKNRLCQIMTASDERLFSIDFWSDGVKYGCWWLPEFSFLIVAMKDFLESQFSCKQMHERYPWFISPEGEIYEKYPNLGSVPLPLT